MSARTVLDAAEIDRAIVRISHEIVEANQGTANLLLLGIPTRGVFLAQRIALAIKRNYPDFDINSSLGKLDVTMFRDDLSSKPGREVTPTEIPVNNLENKVVVLVDDVLFSGRTIRAALDALGEIGRPQTVQLAVLVDRGHRELPIRADYVGKNLPTSQNQVVRVQFTELDGIDLVSIEDGAAQ